MPDYFYGWYLKCQSGAHTLAVIPAVHQTGKKTTSSIQVITDDGAWVVTFPGKQFRRSGKTIYMGNSRFGEKGIKLDVKTAELTIKGLVRFGRLTPLKYDIMGPFALIPFMECRHRVWSMQHSVNGTLSINGQKYLFQNAKGYWEGDSGRSFPREYVWTQCCFRGGSLMLSVADIPVAGIHFTGIIGVVLWRGKEYRLATYLGARAIQIHNGIIQVVQGDFLLEARLLEKAEHSLKAPAKGDMVRTIHESAASRAYYRFRIGSKTLFVLKTDKASFEYEYQA